MCHVCGDDQCHYGEYCYPSGKSIRLHPPSGEVLAEIRSAIERMDNDKRTEELRLQTWRISSLTRASVDSSK